MMITKRIPMVGDTVHVAPTNLRALGRGIGKVVRVGKTLVQVEFQQYPDGPIACLLRDCTVLEARA